MCHKGFAENQQLFFPNCAFGKESGHLREAQQLDFFDLLPGGGPGFGTFKVPEVEIPGKEDFDCFGDVLKAREYPMRFDGEPVIGRLDEMVLGNPQRLCRHFLLVFKAEKVFND